MIHSTLIPPLKAAWQLGAELGDVDARRVGPEQHEVRVAHVDRPGPAVVELLGLVGPEPRRAHVDLGGGPAVGRARAAYSTVRVPAAVATVKRGGRTQPASTAAWARHRMPLPLISASPPSALCSCMETSQPSRPGADPDDPVRADAAAAVGQQADLGHREPDGVVGVEHDQEVVAGPFVLGGVHASHSRS